MIPSRMPIGRPYGEKMHAQRSDEVKDDGRVSKPVVSNKRIMMECRHLMISEPKLLVGGHQVEFGIELQVTGLKQIGESQDGNRPENQVKFKTFTSGRKRAGADRSVTDA